MTLPRFPCPHNVTGAATCANLLENLSLQHLSVEIDCLVVSDADVLSQNAVGHELMSFQVVESDVSDVDQISLCQFCCKLRPDLVSLIVHIVNANWPLHVGIERAMKE